MARANSKCAGMIALLMGATVAQASADVDGNYVGYAYDIETGELIYEEHHTQTAEGQTVMLKTDYRSAEGERFAYRTVEFPAPLSTRPVFELTDERIPYIEGVRRDGGDLLVYKTEDGETERERLPATPSDDRPLVIDAGFDRLVQRQWDRLHDGEFVRFDFLNCDRLSTIPLRLSLDGQRDTEHGPVSDLIMEPNNWFIRVLVDPIQISYRAEDRSLLEYKGISNIRRPGGSNYVVRIYFPPDERTALPPQSVRAEAP